MPADGLTPGPPVLRYLQLQLWLRAALLYIRTSYDMEWKGGRFHITDPLYRAITSQGPVLLTLLRHFATILANGGAAFFESCDAIGWNSCDVSQKR